MESSVSLLLTKEQVRELSVDGIMERIARGIYLDNYAWRRLPDACTWKEYWQTDCRTSSTSALAAAGSFP